MKKRPTITPEAFAALRRGSCVINRDNGKLCMVTEPAYDGPVLWVRETANGEPSGNPRPLTRAVTAAGKPQLLKPRTRLRTRLLL